jgi:hypothetical protein
MSLFATRRAHSPRHSTCSSLSCLSTLALTAMTAALRYPAACRSSGERRTRPNALYEQARGGRISHRAPILADTPDPDAPFSLQKERE